MNATARALVRRHRMKPHPEGGYYVVIDAGRPTPRGDTAAASTAILYLLASAGGALLHRLRGLTEYWYHLQGDAIDFVLAEPGKAVQHYVLGAGPRHHRHLIVPPGAWQGALLRPSGRYALVSCVVAPGFDFGRWQLGKEGDVDRLLRRKGTGVKAKRVLDALRARLA